MRIASPASLGLSARRTATTPRAMIKIGMDLVEEAGGERYHDVVAPAWTTYTNEARRFIAAARAMGLVE